MRFRASSWGGACTPGGKWVGEYLVAHWPDFQAQGIEAKRTPVYSVQEVILDELPTGGVDVKGFVGGWRFPLTQVLDDATWSLPPSAKKKLDEVSPSADPEPAEEEGAVAADGLTMGRRHCAGG